MKLLVLDGNSILNRAFYGIKLLTTKDGRYTNAVYGFMNILIKLEQDVKPDSVAVTFDLKAPTFRHKMYADYKAGRKPMPPELAEQMPVLKDLLDALGYKIIAKEGFEADDLIGTLAAHTPDDSECFIATGDRDSLQLVRKNVKVLLAATKMGRAETTVCDEAKIKEDYGVTPPQMKDIKALMGDSSDNIPGVAGVGKKTAEELIVKYGSIDYIYENLDTLDIRDSLREKLRNDKEKAYLSYKLGTIDTDSPIETDLNVYKKQPADTQRAVRILTSLEMFKVMEKLSLSSQQSFAAYEKSVTKAALLEVRSAGCADVLQGVAETKALYFNAVFEGDSIVKIICVDENYLYVLDDGTEIRNFSKILTTNGLKSYCYNVKPIYSYYLKNGIDIGDIGFDAMLAAYLLNPSAKDYSLERLFAERSIPLGDYGDGELAAAAALPVLCRRLEAELENVDQTGLLNEIEMPLARVLSSMEVYGIEVDREGIENFNVKITAEIERLQAKIYELAGEEFNINSPKQLGQILFEKLEIPTKKKTKTGYSTNADVLEELADGYEIVRDILEYRTYAKLKSTYCDGLLSKISADGRIHSSFNQTETRTGRISSTEPNLQNIPVRTELGREMRKFFVAKEGCTFIDADYSQIELRVLCDIANDENMINAFNSGVDIHTVTASQVFNVPVEEVTPLLRTRAKAVNFGIVYGIGAFSLGKDIGVSRAEADRYIKDYLHHYSGVDSYMKNVVEKAKNDGYVSTLFARRRYLPELASSNGMLRAFGERVARNMPIQGTAADIIKIAMIRVYERLKRENYKARLLLQVHDELIVEAPIDEAEAVRKLVSEEMENACKMKVRLVSDAHIGKTWYEAKG
jgi:DNA polymerase-1